MKVLIMRGVSGAGKTTAAHRLAEGSEAVIVSADSHFAVGGEYQWSWTDLEDAHRKCFRQYLDALHDGVEVVIVDNTNIRTSEILPYMLAAKAYEAEVAVVEVFCDPEVAAARNIHGVPQRAIERMAARMTSDPLPKEWAVIRV